ncbi:ProC Pyrroline-5-carboxylate reductase [Microbacteriaceae bacterium]
MENNKIAVIGAGSMGGAILSGLIAAGTAADSITASTATTQSAKALSDKFGIKSFALDASPSANSDAAENADVLLIAVKPAKVLETLEEIKGSVKDGALVISVAAGVTTESMEQAIGSKASVIRAMPNTPSIVGHGVTGIAKGKSANDNQLSLAKDLFETVGQVIMVDEEKINALSTISGSGPAYVFYFAEKLMSAAKKMGFSEKEANLMVRATFLGSATLLAASSDSPETLRAQVTSPNGTTMQATARFDEADLEKVFIEATEAALARAIELGKNK